MGKDLGNFWEKLFSDEARREGLLIEKNPLSCKILWKGKLELLPSRLDFNLADTDGEHGFFDCKCFAHDHFVYSQIDTSQLDQALLWNEWNVPAGFVVFFRQTQEVVYFSGYEIARAGPGSRFSRDEGLVLGRWDRFNLRPVLARPGGENARGFLR